MKPSLSLESHDSFLVADSLSASLYLRLFLRRDRAVMSQSGCPERRSTRRDFPYHCCHTRPQVSPLCRLVSATALCSPRLLMLMTDDLYLQPVKRAHSFPSDSPLE